jgi:uncharacterized repeat protein (TIGR01451 family)
MSLATFALGQAPSSVTLTPSPSPSGYGQAVTLTAAVTTGATGKVTFYDGTTVLGTSTISGPQATLTTVLLPSGSRSLYAYYLGDSNFAGSRSVVVTQSVVAGASLGLKPPVTYSGGGFESHLVVGDFNGDGKPDLAVTAFGNILNVLLGNGDGTFQAAEPVSLNTAGSFLAIGDFNADGVEDLVVANSSSNNVSVLMGNGDGTFQPPLNVAIGSFANVVVVADFNRDGKPDLAVGGAGGVSVLLGNGDGTFQPAKVSAAGNGGYMIAVADLDGNGIPDLVASPGGSLIYVLLGNGDGTFQISNFAVQLTIESLTVGDLNRDNKADLVIASNFNVSVLLGNGNGTFQTPQNFVAATSPTSVVVGDFNGDGKPDVVVPVNSGGGGVEVLIGNGDGTLQSALSYPTAAEPFFVATGDFNGDGKTDLVVTIDTNYSVSVLLGGAVPDLSISMAHGVGFSQGQTGATYTISVTNTGQFSSIGAVGVIDALPLGIAATGIAGNEWTCILASLSCTRSDSIAPGSSFPNIVLTVTIAGGVTGSVTNTATVSGGGDQNSANNTAASMVTIRLSPAVNLTSSPNPSSLGQTVTLTTTVTPTATGKVTFYDGIFAIGVATISGGQATFMTDLLASGVRNLTATYEGDSNYGPFASPLHAQSVSAAPVNGLQPSTSYQVGNAPNAVVTGDFNRDGKPDLITANFSAGTVSVLLGKGDGTFLPAVDYPAGTNPMSIVVGDFNGDGEPDLALSNGGFYVLLGNGDGSFQAPVAYALGSEIIGIAAADLNGDGITDLLGVSFGGASAFLGNGDGTFQAALTTAIGPFNLWTVADLNGDRKLDLITVGSSLGSPVSVMLGNGDGTFQPPATFNGVANNSPSYVTVGDFNGDGKPDVAVLYLGAVAVLLGNGDGSLRSPVQSTLSSIPMYAELASDVNGDGRLDLAFRDETTNKVWIAFGNGDGTFQPNVSFSTDGNGGIIVSSDFNGDGKADLAVANATTGTVNVFLGGQFPALSISASHNGNFTAGQTGALYRLTISEPTFAAGTAVSVTDTIPAGAIVTSISGDGWACILNTFTCTRSDSLLGSNSYPPINIVVNISGALAPSTIINRATVTMGSATASTIDPTLIVIPSSVILEVVPSNATLGQELALTGFVTAGATGSVTFYDDATPLGVAHVVNGQANLTAPILEAGYRPIRALYSGDSTYAVSTSPPEHLFVGASSSSGFSATAVAPTAGGPSAVAAGDFNLDGKADLAVTNAKSNSVSVLLNAGNGTFQTHLDYSVGAQPVSVAVGDFNGDGKPDLAVANQAGGSLSILLGNGNGTFQTAVTVLSGNQPSSVVAGDFNGDGKVDLAVANSMDSTLSLFLGNGNGTFQMIKVPAIFGTSALIAGDFNNDGKADLILVTNGFSYELLGNGDGTFTTSATVISSLGVMAAGNLNQDFNLDLVSLSGANTVTVWIGGGDGTFPVVQNYPISATPSALAVADVNGDGKMDVVAVSSTNNSVVVLLGDSNGLLQNGFSYPLSVQPSGMIAGEFNGDGATDLAIPSSQSNNLSILLGVLSPVLQISITNTANFYATETGAAYTITVSNRGSGVSSGAITLVDTLPVGLTATAMSGTGWSCVLATLTCTRSDSLAVSQNYPAITLTVNVASNVSSPLVNSAILTGGGSMPASSTDSTAIGVLPPPLLISPANGLGLAFQTISLNWTASAGATSYDVHFGGVPFSPLVANTTSTSYTTPALAPGGTYYWQIVAKNSSGSGVSTIWSFTIAPDAILTSPPPGSTFTSATQTFGWTPAAGATQYWLDVGTMVGSGAIHGAATTATSVTVANIPCSGQTIFVQLFSFVNGVWLTPNRYTYTACTVAPATATMISPSLGSRFASTSQAFSWTTAAGATQYWLDVGTTLGQGDIHGAATTATSATVPGIPCGGQTIYVQLFTFLNGAWLAPNRYTYTACNTTVATAQMTSPTQGSTFTSSTQAFSWTTATSATQYWLDVGTTLGQGNIHGAATTATSATVANIPCNGQTIFVQLFTFQNGAWLTPNRYTYTACTTAQATATMISPTPGSMFASTTQAFSWTTVAGATQYWLDVGTTLAQGNIHGAATTATSATVPNIPCGGQTIFVQLFTFINGAWLTPNRYTYTACTSSSSSGITSPVQGSAVTSPSQAFTWAAASGADQYRLDVGSQLGSGDYFSATTAALTLTATSMPCDGRTVFAQLSAHIGGTWQAPQQNTYTGASGCAALAAPADGATFTSPSVTFSWGVAAGADQYWLDVGNTVGQGDIFGAATTGTSTTVSNVPCDGRPIFVQVWTHIGGAWKNPGRYQFTAWGACGRLTTPAPGSTLSGSTVNFSWAAGTGAITAYWLDVGKSPGSGAIFGANLGTALSHTVSGIPTAGQTIYVQLWSMIGGVWYPNRYSYTAF